MANGRSSAMEPRFLPDTGQISCVCGPTVVLSTQMRTSEELDQLLRHLESLSGLSQPALARLIDEVLSYFSESLDEFVARRHRELQSDALRNDAIFIRIAAELERRRFAAPRLSQRQIRRLIYG